MSGPVVSSLFVQRARELVRRPSVTCRPQSSVAEVARLLTREQVGSVVIVDDAGAPIGIVTDRDLRRKVVAEARDPVTTTAADIMSAPLVTVPADAFAFDALLTMTRQAIHHLAVVSDGALAGVLSTNDFVALEATHPAHLAREIARAPSVAALAAIGARTTALVRQLINAGITAYDIGQLVAELNDRLVAAVLDLVTAERQAQTGSPPPGAYCWLALGSEARREQTLRTDQDNGLVFEDPSPGAGPAAGRWYGEFATTVVDALMQIGFPPCPGGIMASNPQWCQPLSMWSRYFRGWIEEPEPQPVLAAQIHFDLRPVGGATRLGAALRALVHELAPSRRLFLGLLARDVTSRRVPVTIFGNVAVERTPARRGTVDLKAGAALPLTGAARIHALELGIDVTNTIDRFCAAGARGLYTEAETRDITDAFQHVTRLRLVHQLGQMERGEPPDNHLRPARLSRADLLLLRDALRTVRHVQAGMRERFKTAQMG